MPTPGYVCELIRAEPQGSNVRDLLLELKVDEPTGQQSKVLTPCPVKYEEETDMEYDTVSVVGIQTGIPVEITQQVRPPLGFLVGFSAAGDRRESSCRRTGSRLEP